MWPPFRGFVRVFVLICFGVFVLEEFASIGPFADGHLLVQMVRFLGLTPELLFKGMIYQTITWVFLHGSFMHLLFNMFAFWMFGSALEDTWSTRVFTKFVFLSALFSGLMVGASGLIDEVLYTTPTIGASGVVFAILIAISMLFPNQLVLLFFIIPMRMKYFAYIMIGIEFYALYSSNSHGISNIAHLGGALFGYLFVKFGGPRSRLGTPITWVKNMHDRWHYRRMRKKLRIVKPKDELNRWN